MAVLRILGKVSPTAANTDNTLMTAGGSEQILVGAIWVTNRTGAQANYTIWAVSSGETKGNQHLVAFQVILGAGKTDIIQAPLSLAAGDFIIVQAGTANAITFQAHGVVNP